MKMTRRAAKNDRELDRLPAGESSLRKMADAVKTADRDRKPLVWAEPATGGGDPGGPWSGI